MTRRVEFGQTPRVARPALERELAFRRQEDQFARERQDERRQAEQETVTAKKDIFRESSRYKRILQRVKDYIFFNKVEGAPPLSREEEARQLKFADWERRMMQGGLNAAEREAEFIRLAQKDIKQLQDTLVYLADHYQGRDYGYEEAMQNYVQILHQLVEIDKRAHGGERNRVDLEVEAGDLLAQLPRENGLQQQTLRLLRQQDGEN